MFVIIFATILVITFARLDLPIFVEVSFLINFAVEALENIIEVAPATATSIEAPPQPI